MSNPDASVSKSDLVRIVTIDLESKVVSQYLYQQEGGAKTYSNTAITALSASQFLVAERDDDFYKDNSQAFKRIYKINLQHVKAVFAINHIAIRPFRLVLWIVE